MNMRASDILIKALENEGVEYIFGVPGEENLDFLESLHTSSIKFILTRHEQGAGFMAANYGRITEKPGVCLSTLGPGLTNLVTPSAYAFLGAMPMIIISGQKPLKTKQGRFQIIDAIKLMSPITKFSKQVVYPESIPALIREAFRVSMERKMGPVHLELPEDVAGKEVASFHLFDPVGYEYPQATDASIAKAAELIHQSRQPLLLIGRNANRTRIRKSLSKFINKTKIPFFTTQMGKGVVDERHVSYLGTAALSDFDFLHQSIKKSDLIINVGHDVIEKPPFLMEYGKYDGRKVIHINHVPSEIDEIYFPQHNVIGSISHSMKKLGELVSHKEEWDFTHCFEVREKSNAQYKKYADDTRFPMLPQRLCDIIYNNFPIDGHLCLDNGIYKIWFTRNYRSLTSHSLLLDNALATMGAGLPSAIAAKLIHPDKKVIALCGDGGFMMSLQELETAKRLNLDLTVIILNDSAFGMIKWKQENMGFADFGLSFGNPNFVHLIESFGGKGYRPSNDDEFIQCFKECIHSQGLHLIDLAVDYTQNVSMLNMTTEV